MLPENKINELKEELDNCKNPLFFYHDDSDGLCSFLLFYRYKGDGNGIVVKSRPVVDERFLQSVERYEPDKIFVLDLHDITPEFIEGTNVPIIQVDHHLREEPIKGIKIFNPRNYNKNDNIPASTICYQVVKQDLWICAAGTVGDWCLNKETDEFAKENPKLLNPKIKKPGKALFETKLGKLATMLNMILKGKTADIKKTIEEIKKVKSPEEILEQTTKQGKDIYKRAEKTYSKYKEYFDDAEKQISKNKLFIYSYKNDESFTGELSNEILYKHPDKIIIIAREKGDEMKCSLRSATVQIRNAVTKALEGIDGHGGGHEFACGAGIKTKDFDKFIEQFKAELNI